MADTKGIRAGRAFVELGVSDKLTRGLRAAEGRLKAFGAGLRSIGMRLATVGGAALTGLFGSAKTFANIGDNLDEMAARTGVSVETLSELGFAAELAGADLDTLEVGLRKMQKTIGEAIGGSKSAAEALGQLGLSVGDLQGLSPEEQFKLLAERISRIKDPTLRAAAALEVFGKSGTRLLPLIQDGAAGLTKFQQQARALGLTISTQAAKDAASLADAFDTLWKVLKQGAFVIGAALAPTFTGLANAVTRALVKTSAWIKVNQAVVVTTLRVAAAITAGGVALVVLGGLVSGLGAALGGLATIVTGIGTAFGLAGSAIAALISPIGLIIAAVAGLGAAILLYTGAGADALRWLGRQFTWLQGAIYKVVGGIADALAAGDITLAAQVLWLSLKLAWQEGVAALNRAWQAGRQFFLGTTQAMWSGALALAEETFHALEVAWIETTAFLSQTWTRFTAGFQQAWNKAIHWTTQRLLELWGLLDRTFDVDAAKRMADEELASTNAEIERQREAALAARDQRRQRERDESAAQHEATLGEIGQQYEDAQQALEAETKAGRVETQRQLAEARRQLDEAITRARQQRALEQPEAGGPRHPKTDPLAELEDRLLGLGQRLSIQGTFNPAAVQGLATSGPAERTARATEQTAAQTRRLVQLASLGMRFGTFL